MRLGTLIHSAGPKDKHDRLGIPSQDQHNNLENIKNKRPLSVAIQMTEMSKHLIREKTLYYEKKKKTHIRGALYF